MNTKQFSRHLLLFFFNKRSIYSYVGSRKSILLSFVYQRSLSSRQFQEPRRRKFLISTQCARNIDVNIVVFSHSMFTSVSHSK